MRHTRILMGIFSAILSYLLAPVVIPVLAFHPKMKQGLAARLGLYPRGWPQPPLGRPRVLLHGASAGDIRALLPTARALLKLRPDAVIIATTLTNSGKAMAERHREVFSLVTFLPYDLPGAVRRLLRRCDPDVVVLEYTELWPNLIHAARARHIPLVLHNGRISREKLRQYRWLFALTGNLLRAFRVLLMRDDSEADRATLLGAPLSRLKTTGNTKFDNLRLQVPQAEQDALWQRTDWDPKTHLVWVAGSTHDGEESIVLKLYKRLRRQYAHLRLIIAPRYAERGSSVASRATRHGWRAALRSTREDASSTHARAHAQAPPTPPRPPLDVLVMDTIGELSSCYAMADVVFVGGSFVARGGQNILEPAACGKPVLFGPNMANFADSVQVLLGRGGVQAASPAQLERVMFDLLRRPQYRAELGYLGKQQVQTRRGAAQRNAQEIVALLPGPKHRNSSRQRKHTKPQTKAA